MSLTTKIALLVLLMPAWAWAAPTIVSSDSTRMTVGNDTLIMDNPGSLSDSDYLFVFIMKDDNGAGEMLEPAGWTEYAYLNTNTGSDQTTYIGYKPITSASGEPSTYAFSWSATDPEDAVGIIVAIRDLAWGANLFDAAVVSLNMEDTTSNCPSITTAHDSSMVIYFVGIRTVTSPIGVPSGTTGIRVSTSTSANGAPAWKYVASPGASGVGAYTLTGGGSERHGHTIALRYNATVAATRSQVMRTTIIGD